MFSFKIFEILCIFESDGNEKWASVRNSVFLDFLDLTWFMASHYSSWYGTMVHCMAL